MVAAIFLAVSSALVFYILIGYPLILALRKGRVAPAIRKDPNYRPTVSVVMAVRDGERFLRAKLESLLALRYPRELVEILVVSDGSTDGTDAIAGAYAPRGVRLLRVPRGGKAAALNEALQYATGGILFFTDVRQTLHPDALNHLVANLADPTVGAVSGELRLLHPARAGEQADLELYWRYEVWARNRLSRIDSTFGATGCIYAIRRSLVDPIPPDTLADDVTIPARAFLRGFRVVFEGQAIAYDYPTAEGGEFRRKLRTLAGLWQAHVRMPGLFTRANRMRFHFFSHKSARLLLPWAVLGALASTVALPHSGFRDSLLAGEALGAGLAFIDRLVPKRLALRRATSPLRTFMAINAAAMLAVMVFFVPAGRLWGTTRVKAEAAIASPNPR